MEVGAIRQFEDQFVSPAVMKAHLKVRQDRDKFSITNLVNSFPLHH
jgi:hypothetical protein